MSNRALPFVAFVFALVFCFWSYLDWTKAGDTFQSASIRHQEAEETIAAIRKLKAHHEGTIRIVPGDINPAKIVFESLTKSGLEVSGSFSATPTRLSKIESTNIRKWKLVFNRPLEGTLQQFDKFVRLLATSDFDLQIGEPRVTALKPTAEAEKWRFEFAVHYLVESPE